MEQAVIIIGGAIVALVGTIYGVRTSSRNTVLANRIDGVKAEALAKAEVLKVSTEAETKRTDALLDTQLAFIKDLQAENRAQRQEMLDKDKLHREEMMQVRQEVMEISRLMNNCVEARQLQEKTVAELSAEVLRLKSNLQHPESS